MDSSNENEIIKLIESYFGERVKLDNELILNDRKFPVKGLQRNAFGWILKVFFHHLLQLKISIFYAEISIGFFK